jgi:hypothetical protein
LRQVKGSEADAGGDPMGEDIMWRKSSSEPTFQFAFGREAWTGSGPGKASSSIKSLLMLRTNGLINPD